MWKSNQGTNGRRLRDWLWWLVLLAYIFVPTILIMAQIGNLRAWLTLDGADALAAMVTSLIAITGLSLGSSCITGLLAELVKWLHIEQHTVGRAIVAIADALDISSSRDAVRFVDRCRLAIREVSRRSPYAQLGTIGNVKAAFAHSQSVIKGHRGQGRQAGAATATRSKSGSKSADDDGDGDGDGDGGGDGEPPRQLFYTYSAFSELFGVAPQTLRNKVSAGQFPAPVKTAFGPRFTQKHFEYALNPSRQPDDSVPRQRGRPRIARSQKTGGGL